MRKFLLGGALALCSFAAIPVQAVSTQTWATGTNGCITTTSVLTTQLNSIATASNAVASSVVNNSGGSVYATIQFTAGGTFTPTANAYINIWFLKSLDASVYEDGSDTVSPGRAADAIINVRAGTTITPISSVGPFVLPGLNFKVLAQNNTGATLPSSGNTIILCTQSLSQ